MIGNVVPLYRPEGFVSKRAKELDELACKVVCNNKILVAGIKGPVNQFTRFLDKIGMPYELWDERGEVPIYDAVILSTVHISHERHAKIRRAYKDAGKRVFAAGISVSCIKEDFGEWVAGLADAVRGLENTGEDMGDSSEIIEHILTVRNALSGLTSEVKSISERMSCLEGTFLETAKDTSRLNTVIDKLAEVEILKEKISVLDEEKLEKLEKIIDLLGL